MMDDIQFRRLVETQTEISAKLSSLILMQEEIARQICNLSETIGNTANTVGTCIRDAAYVSR